MSNEKSSVRGADGRRTSREQSPPVRVSRAASAAAAVALVVAATHILLTATFNTPYSGLKYDVLPGRAADSYINPYLVQDYRIFAPDPASSDRNLWVRAWVEKPDGERVETAWIDATGVELAAPYRRVLRKQLTVLAAERLMGAYGELTDAQKQVAEENFHRDHDLNPLRAALLEADEANSGAVNSFIRVSNFVTSYATQVAYAMWEDEGEVLGVQVRSVYSPVIRWEDRFDDSARPPGSSYTDLGWRPVMEWSAQDRDAFARSFTRWAEHAGVSAETGSGQTDGERADDETDGDAGAGGEE